MGYHNYGELGTVNTIGSSFCLGFVCGSLGPYLNGAWLLVAAGWTDPPGVGIACGIVGIVTGCVFAWHERRC